MSVDIVKFEKRGSAFWITLNRPEKRNAINSALIDGIREGFQHAQDDPEVRCIVLTGSGDKAFCAGGDLQPGTGFNIDFGQPHTPYGDMLRHAHACPLPMLAVINGTCVAGGMGLLAMVDLAISVDTAKFGLPEAKIGLFPMQVLALMKTLVSPRIMREWMLTGDIYTAQEAMAAGMLNRVVASDKLHEAAEAMIARLSGTSPTALRRGKYVMRAIEQMTFDQAISFAEGQIGLMSLSEDAQEGLASFNEKRRPVFKGR